MYGKDEEFADPVVRCDSCQSLLQMETLRKVGMCKCGNRKVRNVLTHTSEELEQMKAWNVDPVFLALFEGVPDA